MAFVGTFHIIERSSSGVLLCPGCGSAFENRDTFHSHYNVCMRDGSPSSHGSVSNEAESASHGGSGAGSPLFLADGGAPASEGRVGDSDIAGSVDAFESNFQMQDVSSTESPMDVCYGGRALGARGANVVWDGGSDSDSSWEVLDHGRGLPSLDSSGNMGVQRPADVFQHGSRMLVDVVESGQSAPPSGEDISLSTGVGDARSDGVAGCVHEAFCLACLC